SPYSTKFTVAMSGLLSRPATAYPIGLACGVASEYLIDEHPCRGGARMAAKVKPIPDGYHTITPYLSIKGAADAIEFYKQAFGAAEVMRMAQPDGRVGHAELTIGDAKVMLADEFPEMDFRSPHSFGGSPVHLHLYVEDVDAVVERAVAAGAKQIRPVQD